MRLPLSVAIVVFLSTVGFAARAEPTVAALSQKLQKAAEPAERIRAAQQLAAASQPAATQALCAALSGDADEHVRVAAARALGEQGRPEALDCLDKAGEQSPEVKAEVASAQAVAKARSGVKPSRYILLPPVEDRAGSLDAQVLVDAERVLREQLAAKGAVFARPEEPAGEARKVMKAKKLDGYQLKVQLTLIEGGGLALDLACFTYPERKLIGALKVDARGARPATLVEAIVPQAVDEAATTCKWKR